jgi:inner membrane protein
MDPITHALLGGTIGYIVGAQKLGRHATVLGALAGITPDIDHFVRSDADPLLYAEFHRSFTHALPLSLLAACVPLLPWLLHPKLRAHWKILWLCAWTAYVSHCLLDASTTWGTQLWLPFTRARTSWDFIAIVDPIFTLILAMLLSLGLWRRSRAVAGIGLALASAYLVFGVSQHARGLTIQKQLATERHHTMERSEVMPTLGNNVIWRSVYLADGRIFSDRIRVGWFSAGTVRPGMSLPLVTTNTLTAAERAGNERHHGFARFNWFTDSWVARAPDDATVIGDMRYSRADEAFDPVWGIRLFRDHVEWVSQTRDRRFDAKKLWKEISGDDPRYRAVGTK